MVETIVLGSENRVAEELLTKVGVPVMIMAADLDDRAIEAPLEETGATPDDFALVLAEARATQVSEEQGDSLVLGCEQIFSLDSKILRTPINMDQVRRRLLLLSGKTHQVSNAMVLARRGEVLWRHTSEASLTMRKLEPEDIGRYLAEIDIGTFETPGIYKINEKGIRLFDDIQGDYFTILGVSLLPLLAELRRLGTTDW